jgi:protein-tyrosine phosphatase
MFHKTVLMMTAAFLPVAALAVDKAEVRRVDNGNVELTWEDSDKVDIYLSPAPDASIKGLKPIKSAKGNGSVLASIPASERHYFLIKDHGDKSIIVMAERLLPLDQGSNFRDVGGYKGAGGKTIRWGKIYRSGAMPMLSENDYKLLGSLNIKSMIDLRSTDEREVAPTSLDDRTGALFLSNDYSLAPLMKNFTSKQDNFYAGMEKMLAPQLRQVFNRLLNADGATVYNCSAGQDRTGMTTALVYSALGVDRETIVTDYHLSTPSRRPEWEMPKVDPADYPGNVIVQYYAAAAKKPGGNKAEPLYTKAGRSHLVEFFEYLDREYGGVDAYMEKELQVGPKEIARLREIYLES